MESGQYFYPFLSGEALIWSVCSNNTFQRVDSNGHRLINNVHVYPVNGNVQYIRRIQEINKWITENKWKRKNIKLIMRRIERYNRSRLKKKEKNTPAAYLFHYRMVSIVKQFIWSAILRWLFKPLATSKSEISDFHLLTIFSLSKLKDTRKLF